MTLDPATTPLRSRAARSAVADQACVEAVELARAGALDVAGVSAVGEHLGHEVEDERVVTHRFASLEKGYRGWHWAVTVARASRAKLVTVDEVVLLPGAQAILAPAWVPWSRRLRPGDLGVGDLLPTQADDLRLQPGWSPAVEIDGAAGADLSDEDVAAVWEPGLGRARVLSQIGRDDAVDRWYTGDHGPRSPIAEAAPASCATCGFLVLLGGSLRRVFGVCANEYAPDDGRVVSLDHGCGAHSEAVVVPNAAAMGAHALDDLGVEVVHVVPEPAGDSVEDSAVEDLGHS